jgi:HK97 family phage major capsid protein
MGMGATISIILLTPIALCFAADGLVRRRQAASLTARSIRWKTDESLLFGNGAGNPLGAYLSGGPAVMVPKEGGQPAATLVPENLVKMVSRMLPGSYGRAVWMVNNDVLPQLWTLNKTDQMLYVPDFKQSPYGALLGRPVMVSQHCKSIGAMGDIMLADFGSYRAITKAGGIQTATSMHLYFDADAVAFRATFRVDGAPKMSKAVTPANGSATLSPFVQLEAR